MRKFTLVVLQILCVAFVAHAQSFKLYYANNVTDVADLDDIEEDGSGLNWREVATGSTMFIPLTHNDVYLLNTGEEVFKFRY